MHTDTITNNFTYAPVRVFRCAKGWFLGTKDALSHCITRQSSYFSDPESAHNALLHLA